MLFHRSAVRFLVLVMISFLLVVSAPQQEATTERSPR
jgi:hypothetical protein